MVSWPHFYVVVFILAHEKKLVWVPSELFANYLLALLKSIISVSLSAHLIGEVTSVYSEALPCLFSLASG